MHVRFALFFSFSQRENSSCKKVVSTPQWICFSVALTFFFYIERDIYSRDIFVACHLRKTFTSLLLTHFIGPRECLKFGGDVGLLEVHNSFCFYTWALLNIVQEHRDLEQNSLDLYGWNHLPIPTFWRPYCHYYTMARPNNFSFKVILFTMTCY